MQPPRWTRRNFVARAAAGALALGVRAAPARARRGGPLFVDRFERRDRRGWGAPWFNQRYGREWRVGRGAGVLRLPYAYRNSDYRPAPVLVLDHDVADVDVRAVISVTNATARAGVVARADGYADYYAAYLAPKGSLRVARCGAASETLLGRAPRPFRAGRRYHVRLRVSGDGPVHVRAKAWPHGEREPRRWSVSVADSSPDALSRRGAFGVVAQHAADRRPVEVRVHDFVARSQQARRTTAPAVAYALAGMPRDGNRIVRVVAKTAVPARVAFEYGADPTFTHDVERVAAGRTSARGVTAHAALDLTRFAPGTLVHWRVVAVRGGARVVGPASRLRTAPPLGLPVRFAFGSCTPWQRRPHASFERARAALPDFYLHQGDFGYAQGRVAVRSRDAFQDHWVRVLMDARLAGLARETPVALCRDDGEYGANSAYRDTVVPFTIPAHDELNANPVGPYFESRYAGVAVFAIDCRRFSTSPEAPVERRTKLGREQKRWLKERMRRAAADDGVALLVVASPQSFGSDSSPASFRRKFHAEWLELVDFFQSLGRPVLIVSGDAHGHRLHEYPQKDMQLDVPRIVEFTSSGTERRTWSDARDDDVLITEAKAPAFGLVELGAEQDIAGRRARMLTLSAIHSFDGTPLFSRSYVVVPDLGIVPASF